MMKDRPSRWLGFLGLVAVAFVAFALGLYAVDWREHMWNKEEPEKEGITEGTEQERPSSNAYGDDTPGVSDALLVDWIPVEQQKAEPVDAAFLKAFDGALYTGGDAKGSWMYKLGTLKGPIPDGERLGEGDALYLAALEMNGLGPQYQYYYLVTDYGSSGQVTVLTRYGGWSSFGGVPSTQEILGDAWKTAGWVNVANATPSEISNQVTYDDTASIAEFNQVPGGVVKGDSGHAFVIMGFGSREDLLETDLQSGRLLDDPTSTMYLRVEGVDKNLFFTQRPDGRIVWYDLEMPFWQPGKEDTTAVPAITWNDGSKNTKSYVKALGGGCGFLTFTNVVDKGLLGELVQAGTTQSGDPVYIQKAEDSQILLDAYHGWKSQDDTRTFDQFKTEHPFFYYQDILGRWIQFTNSDMMPPGECGKPVIYLYPPTTQDLTVQLAPAGGFTKTEPAYRNGWSVRATPEGALTDLADGKTYPYLFWEGRGGLYEEPKDYWVVAEKDVPSFLSSTLQELGLNKKETADFEEFWLPRMTSAKFYKIGFHGTSVMNQLAPMTLSEEADTMIRILMDYQPLNAPIPARPPVLPKTPSRSGFTVVEWGGVLR